jgi:hypothetical protein
MNQPQPRSASIGHTEELANYLEQLLQRDRFRKAPGLRQLLQYVVQTAAEGKVDEIKESTIAMDVFGKSHDFDSRLDNIVRVQAHRLRKTLEAYYEAEGAGDKFRISVPKGGYIPSIEIRDEPAVLNPPVPLPLEPAIVLPLPPAPVRPPLRKWAAFAGTFLAGALFTLLVISLAAPQWLAGRRTAAAAEDPTRLPLASFWGGFLDPARNCIVSFTNPVFLWTQTAHNRIYMPYLGPLSAESGAPVEISPGAEFVEPELVKKGRPFFFSDRWTGTGEVFSIYQLTKLFAGAGHPLKVIRSRTLTYDDLRDSNVIFLGSPWANEMQDKINPGQTPLACLDNGKIGNLEPRPGEQPFYQAVHDSQSKAQTTTYALISVLPGVTAGTRVVSSAGVDTYGTSAGIDFLTSPAGISELMRRFDPQGRKKLPPFFQAVIRTEIVRGDPGRSDLVLVREVPRKSLVGPQ